MSQIDSTDMITDTQREARAKEIASWTEEQAREKAKKQGIELTQEHLQVLEYLREVYIADGWEIPTHIVSQRLKDRFEQMGGLKRLHELFPDGPMAQGSDWAGLPVPPYAEDDGFGSVQ